MKLTSLAKFFRFCGFGIALTCVIFAIGAFQVMPSMEDLSPFFWVLTGLIVLFIFAVTWIIHSFYLEREGRKVDDFYQQAIAEYEQFKKDSSDWTAQQIREAHAS